MKIQCEPIFKTSVTLKDLEIGELAFIDDLMMGNQNGEIILRTFDGAVSLTNPRNTWNGLSSTFKMRRLPAGHKVILTQE